MHIQLKYFNSTKTQWTLNSYPSCVFDDEISILLRCIVPHYNNIIWPKNILKELYNGWGLLLRLASYLSSSQMVGMQSMVDGQ